MKQMSKQKKFQLASIYGGVALLLIVAIGWAFWAEPGPEETDLTQIGKGRNVIVQIHDTGCQYCRKLKASVDAVKDEYKEDILFLIADLNSKDGKWFAQYHRVGKVTLLFFDPQGNRISTLSGVQDEEFLRSAFTRTFKL